MSSSGIDSINSGPLIIRTYLEDSVNNTYLLGNYDIPIPNNRVLITSTNGLLAPSDNISVSSIRISSLNVNTARISTSYLSTVFSINSTITFYNQVNIQNANATEIGPPSLNVIGPTILADQNAATDVVNSSVLTVWGQEPSNIITQNFTATGSYTINGPINTIQFQMIGAGGSKVNGNQAIQTQNLPGYGGYIQGTLKVKQGDSLFFTIGDVGGSNSSSGGTSLIHISSGVSTLVAIVGAGGGNGFATGLISSSSGGGGGGGGTGAISGANSGGFINGIANGTKGFDGLIYVNGVITSDTDGGQGGITIFGGDGGPPNGTDGEAATFVSPFTNLANGGLVVGGAGGTGTGATIYKGGYGGGGYSGGGGAGASTVTSAGGGGGATFINFLQLSDRLIDIVSLSGQYLFENAISIFGAESYGTPTYQGFGTLSGYIPNQTIYTNGDIRCRVLKYDLLDPPVEGGGGGSSALWSLHPAINTVHMNDHSIVECSSIQVIGGGTDVTGNSIFRNQLSTLDKLTVIDGGASITGSSFYFNSTNPASTNTFKLELNGANLLAYRSTVNGTNATFLQNTGGGQLVLATSTPTIFINGSGAGPKNAYVGIGNNNPQYQLDVSGSTRITYSTITDTLNVNTISSGITTSGTTNSNFLNVNTISSGNVVNTLIKGDGILLTGTTTGGNYIGNVTVSAVARPFVDIQTYSSADIPSNYGKYAIITDNTQSSIVLPTNPVPPNGSFINLINQSGIPYVLNTSGIVQTLENNTLITPIYFQGLSRWLAPSYYVLTPLYIYINNTNRETNATSGYFASQIGNFNYLDYAIVGGGGGGGSSDRTNSGAHYGGGGGGSGYLIASYYFDAADADYNYNIVPTAPSVITINGGNYNSPPAGSRNSPDSTNTKISLNGYSKVTVTIGGGGGVNPTQESQDDGNTGNTGGSTVLTVYYTNGTSVTRTVYGGYGGTGGLDSASITGSGGYGWNGGGAASGGSGGGVKGRGFGGNDGVDGTGSRPGRGGGQNNQGGSVTARLTNNTSENAGGGGAGGAGVVIAGTGIYTGGAGAASFQSGFDNENSSVGTAYTGGGGGGGSDNVGGGVRDPSAGGKGYAILYFHN